MTFDKHSAPPPGAIFRRCACKNDEGKQLGMRCPRLTDDVDHGVWTYRLVIPADHNGFRRGIKRGGFASREAATNAWCEMHHAVRVGVARARTSSWRSRDYLIAARAMLAEDMRLIKLTGAGDAVVYAALAPPYVKIGHSRDAQGRVAWLKNKGHAGIDAPEDADFETCRLWRTGPGSRVDERAIHHLCRNYWVRGEWFWADPALIGCP